MFSKKILLFGYWENNLGDDLFLKLFVESFPEDKIYILTRKKNKEIYKYNNLRIIFFDSLIYRVINKFLRYHKFPDYYYLRYTRKSNAAVLLGGSLFMETDNWKKQIQNLNYVVDNCSNTYVVGSNFGPYTSTGFLDQYKSMFSKMKRICFRDKYSFSLFKDESNIFYAPDAVLSLTFESDSKLISNNYGDYCIISLIDLKNRNNLSFYKKEYESKILDICIELSNRGLNIVLMSFCEKEGDLEVANSINMKLRELGITSFVYNHKMIDESLSIIKKAKSIIATRLHSMILAFLFNIPVFPIPYSEKMVNIINDYNFNNPYARVEDIASIKRESIADALFKKPNIEVEILESSKKHLQEIEV